MNVQDEPPPGGVVAVDELARMGGSGHQRAGFGSGGVAAEDLVAPDAQARGAARHGGAALTALEDGLDDGPELDLPREERPH